MTDQVQSSRAKPRLTVTTRTGLERVIEGSIGASLMEAMRDGGIDELLALCGGCCSCATCHVYIDTALCEPVSQQTAEEDELLDTSENRQPTSRLSCQIKLSERLDGLRVTIAPED